MIFLQASHQEVNGIGVSRKLWKAARVEEDEGPAGMGERDAEEPTFRQMSISSVPETDLNGIFTPLFGTPTTNREIGK